MIAYKKGGERERFNPLTGARYDRQQTHDIDIEEQDNTKLSVPSHQPNSNRQFPGSSRGRNGFFRGNEEGSRWKGKGRANSPYQKPTKEQSVKTVEVTSKTKEKP